jgi:hypothetical protein
MLTKIKVTQPTPHQDPSESKHLKADKLSQQLSPNLYPEDQVLHSLMTQSRSMNFFPKTAARKPRTRSKYPSFAVRFKTRKLQRTNSETQRLKQVTDFLDKSERVSTRIYKKIAMIEANSVARSLSLA